MDRTARAKISHRGIICGKRYPWPEPFKSDTDFDRFNGRDIDTLTELDKWMELKRLEDVLPWVDERAILIVDLIGSRIITKLEWGLDRIKKLKKGAA